MQDSTLNEAIIILTSQVCTPEMYASAREFRSTKVEWPSIQRCSYRTLRKLIDYCVKIGVLTAVTMIDYVHNVCVSVLRDVIY
jgi:hypothetical protein